MFGRARKLRIETERLTLRPPQHGDYHAWAALRAESRDFLTPWEPTWALDHLSRKSFSNRVYWSARAVSQGSALPLFLVRREDEVLLGALTLDNIRRGPAQAATAGYWIGAPYVRRGYARQAIRRVLAFAWSELQLNRIEAAVQPQNAASRQLLEEVGFVVEGRARGLLKIAGEWRDHDRLAILREDRADG